jgi:hypothetical protein
VQLITPPYLDAISSSNLNACFQARYNQLSEDTDVPPNIVQVEVEDDITGPDYAFVGNNGLLSDLFEDHQPRHSEGSVKLTNNGKMEDWSRYLQTWTRWNYLRIVGSLATCVLGVWLLSAR